MVMNLTQENTVYDQIIEKYDMSDRRLHYRLTDFYEPAKKGSGATPGFIVKSKLYKNERLRNKREILVLFKKGHNDGETIAEYLASKIYDAFHLTQGKAAKCFLLYDEDIGKFLAYDAFTQANPLIDIGTIFFAEYSPLFKEADDNFKKRPLFARILHGNKIEKIVQSLDPTPKNDLIRLLTVALWLNDYDVHWENLGFAYPYYDNDRKTIVKIDHGWSFADLTPQLGLKSVRLTPGKPTNHFWDYASNKNGIFNSQSHLDCLAALQKAFFQRKISVFSRRKNALCQVDFCGFLEILLDDIYDYYQVYASGENSIKSFSKHVGMNPITGNTRDVAKYIAGYLGSRLQLQKTGRSFFTAA